MLKSMWTILFSLQKAQRLGQLLRLAQLLFSFSFMPVQKNKISC